MYTNTTQIGAEACHNCRRQRLKCDRSLPHCLKCTKRGQECLGYQRLLRWGSGMASRGKMTGMTFDKLTRSRMRHENSHRHSSCPVPLSSQQQSRGYTRGSPPLGSIPDPLVQDLSQASRTYLHYFASNVCKNLVLYDSAKHNPFRELVPLTHKHPILLHIVIAIAALHMSNTCQKSWILDSDMVASSPPNRTRQLGSPHSSTSSTHQVQSYNDALAAKQRALELLKSTLTTSPLVNMSVTLAVVLLFAEFELIDSGRDNWRYHINAARAIVERLWGLEPTPKAGKCPLRSCLISNYLVYDILGSAFSSSVPPVISNTFSTRALSLLQDAEGNHCSSFPAILLQLIRAGTYLHHASYSPCPSSSTTTLQQEEALRLLYTARSFNPLAWARSVQKRSPAADLLDRTYIGSAHRAAVCIYLSRIILSIYPTIQLSDNLESLVTDTITHLSFIHQHNPLFTATTWPAFVAGAETSNGARQEWVAQRLQEMWEVEPWGLIKGAMGVLETIWAKRRSWPAANGEASPSTGNESDWDWIADLRGSGVDWLII